jgi:putative heme-binding domain-containing protein
VYLQAPSAAAKTVALLERASTQEEQIEYARTLRALKAGWTPGLRRAYFSWFPKAATFKGGNSFPGFMRNIRRDAEANLSEADREQLKPILAAVRPSARAAPAPQRTVVKKWTLDELVPMVDSGLKHRDYDRGHAMFAEAKCFSCHRFNNEGGGLGPDLSGVAGRFSVRDLLESVVLPNKTISDQYAAVVIATSSGRVVTGRIVNLAGSNLSICPDMLDPGRTVNVRREDIEEMKPSAVSMMPEGLLDTLHRDDILDLVAYLLSRGDRNAAMFKNAAIPAASR